VISATIKGRPVPWARAKRGKNGKSYTPAKQKAHREMLAWEIKAAAGKIKKLTPPIEVHLDFNYGRSETVVMIYSKEDGELDYDDRWPRGGRTKRPDIDNLAKQILEALELSGIIGDDAEVAFLSARKVE
jgi:Holliday junction resolvase RusA-like endonuclease